MKMQAVAQVDDKRFRGFRSGAFGLLFAGLGFTYALATSGGNTPLTLNAGSRAIGTACPRLATQFVTDPNLGTILAGSLFKRAILCRFGIPPYTFKQGAQRPVFVVLLSNGFVSGTPDPTVGGPVPFDVVEFDFAPPNGVQTHIQQTFTLNVIPSTLNTSTSTSTSVVTTLPPLTIVSDSILSTAVTGQGYQYSIQADGGSPPYKFNLVQDPDLVAMTSPQNVPDGITVQSDGTVGGDPSTANTGPTLPGAGKFAVRVTDSEGFQFAKSFSLPVVQGAIDSPIVVTKGSFNLKFGKDGAADSLQLSMVLNKDLLGVAGIRKASDLNGVPFEIKFGGALLPGNVSTGTDTTTSTNTSVSVSGTAGTGNVFDANGLIQLPQKSLTGGEVVTQNKHVTYKISLNPATGVLNAAFNGIDLIDPLNAQFRDFTTNPNIPIEVLIGNQAIAGLNGQTGTSTGTSTDTGINSLSYDKSALARFQYRRAGNSGKGSSDTDLFNQPAGQFIVLKVNGKESINQSDRNFDTVQLSFSGILRLPSTNKTSSKLVNPILPNATDVVSVIVGGTNNSCIGSFPASSFTQTKDAITFVNNDPTIPLHSLTIDNRRGRFFFDTNPIQAFRIFAQDVLDSGTPQLVPVIISFGTPDGKTATFDATSSVSIFRKGNKLLNK